MPQAAPPTPFSAFIGKLITNFGWKSLSKNSKSLRYDGFYLRLHYRWTFTLFLFCFFAVNYSWYYQETIECKDNFNAEKDVPKSYLNICLSYSYIEVAGDRRYLLYYRWISWLFLLLAGIYYTPRLMIKYFEEKKEINILKVILIHVFPLFINTGAFFFIHYIVLSEQFLLYGYEAFPYKRDPENFSDVMSKIFPPFVQCEIIGELHRIIGQRFESLGCHFTLMELYEKIFLFLWFWMIILAVITAYHWLRSLSLFILSKNERHRQTDIDRPNRCEGCGRHIKKI